MHAAPVTTTHLHVATNPSTALRAGGNDAWSGTLPEPNAAGTDGPFATLRRARDAIRALKAASGLPAGGVTVVVAAGEYTLREPLAFDARDSGSAGAPVVWRAAEGASVRLSGGVRLGGWQVVDDPATLARLHPDARGKVLRTDLRAHGITDFGAMESAPNWATSDPGLELFFRDRPMALARYPNDGYLRIAALSVDDGHHIRGTRGSRVGRFRITGERERLRRWAAEPGAMLHGYWFWDWADQRLAVSAIDTESGEIALDDRQPHSYGYRAGQWFYAFNLLCELDQPGEWYLDRGVGVLYFWPPEAPGEGDAVVSVVRDPITLDQVSHLTLQGFTIEAARGTAIRVTGGEAVRIAGCTVRNVGADAVRIEGGRGHVVSDCDICQTGDGGIHLEGGDRRTLRPGRHEAVNNHVHHLSRWNPLYKVGIQLKGCGNRAANNLLHDLPHVAIGFTGNDQTVEFNEIYRCVTKANDAGAIYTAGAGPEDWTMRGHRIRCNYLHHLVGFRGEGCNGIYLDDMFSGTAIYGNILYRVAQGFLLGGGRDIIAENNVFVDCPRAISLDARALGWAAFVVPELIALLEGMPYRQEPWASRYPELVNILADEPAVPKGNVIVRNLFRGGHGNYIEATARPGLRLEDNLEDEDPRFVDEDCLDFRLREGSPAWKLGFQAIPVERIGLQASPLRPSLPSRPRLEVELAAERPPALQSGRCLHPGALRLRVRSIGATSETASLRIHAGGGHLTDGDTLSFALAPGKTHERRLELWAAAKSVLIEVRAEADEDVLAVAHVTTIEAGMTPWPAALRVSDLQPGAGKLATLDRVPLAPALHWQRVAVDDRSGFLNVHDRLAAAGEADGVLYFGCRAHCAEPMRVAVLLGYDGPVRLFVDGAAVFHDPDGANPGRPDIAAPEVALDSGDHELTVALGANRGLAYGIFLRLRRTDLDAGPNGASEPLLPEILAT